MYSIDERPEVQKAKHEANPTDTLDLTPPELNSRCLVHTPSNSMVLPSETDSKEND